MKWTLYYFNPFKKSNHSHVKKKLRPITTWICPLFPEATKLLKVCDKCRKVNPVTSTGQTHTIPDHETQ